MTRYDQQFLSAHAIHVPDEDVTELSPDDLAEIDRLRDEAAWDRLHIGFLYCLIGAMVAGWAWKG